MALLSWFTPAVIGGMNGYHFPYIVDDARTSEMVPFGADFIDFEYNRFKLLKRTESGFELSWTSDELGLNADTIESKWVAVEGDRLYMVYLDQEERAAGIVLERQGNVLTQIATMDMSAIRGDGYYDVLHLKKIMVRQGDLFVFADYFGSNPECVILSEDEGTWRWKNQLKLEPSKAGNYYEPVAVFGDGEEKSFLMISPLLQGSTYDVNLNVVDVFKSSAGEWSLDHAIEFESEASFATFSIVTSQEEDNFILISGAPRTAENIQEFVLVDNQWSTPGVLGFPDLNDLHGNVWQPYVSRTNRFILPMQYEGVFHLIEFLDGEWQIAGTRRFPDWQQFGAESGAFVNQNEILFFSTVEASDAPEKYMVAIFSADDLAPLSKSWFEGASIVADEVEWLPNLGYYWSATTPVTSSTWIYSYELGWLYVPTREGDDIAAWSCNLETWINIAQDSYNQEMDRNGVYAFDQGEFIWHYPGTEFPRLFYSFERNDLVSDFNNRDLLNSYAVVREVLENWDHELLGEDPNLWRASVTTEYYNKWILEMRVFLEGQFWTFKLFGTFEREQKPNGFNCHLLILIDVNEVEISAWNGKMTLNVEDAWTQYQLELPDQFDLDVRFNTIDSGRVTGGVHFNSGESQSLDPFEFPYEDPPPKGN